MKAPLRILAAAVLIVVLFLAPVAYARAQWPEGGDGCMFFAGDDQRTFEALVAQHKLRGQDLIDLMTEASAMAERGSRC
jgi:hypothetical protein